MLRRTIGISATAAAITLAAIAPASAGLPPGGIDSYAAGAKATAIDLTVFGEALTVSDTAAAIDSTAKAVASGKALLTPAFSSAPKAVSSTGAAATEQDCTELDLPSPANLAALDIVCVDMSAAVAGGNPISSSTSDEIVIEIIAPDLIADTPLADVVGEVQTGLGQLFDALVPVTQPLEEATQVQLTDIIDGLLAEVQEGDVLARITVAPTASTSQLGSAVAANAVSNGVIVELLPNLPGGALAVATVGSSTAGIVRDTLTGKPTITGEAALLNVTYPNQLLGGLAVLTDALGEAVNVTVDQLACTDANPLKDVLCFTLGTTNDLDAAEAKALGFDFGANTVGRETSVLGLTLLAKAPEGGIVLNVGHTAAAAGSAVNPDAPLPSQNEDPTAPRAQTGGEAALPLTLALLAVGVAGNAVLRRTRTV